MDERLVLTLSRIGWVGPGVLLFDVGHEGINVEEFEAIVCFDL